MIEKMKRIMMVPLREGTMKKGGTNQGGVVTVPPPPKGQTPVKGRYEEDTMSRDKLPRKRPVFGIFTDGKFCVSLAEWTKENAEEEAKAMDHDFPDFKHTVREIVVCWPGNEDTA
jgi:hypothetical protein